jgi:phosphoglycerate transporter family protein
MPNPFAPPPDQPRLPDQEVARIYPSWRIRQLYSIFFGYIFFYLIRKNISMALPSMEKNLGYSKADLGKILTYNEIVYGVSKFTNGVAADRSNARTFMSFGLLLAGLSTLAFGWSSTLWTLSLCWMINGWFQGMGFPPCARVLSHWFSVRERGFKWSLWATSQQVGAGAALILSGYLAQRYGWRAVFVVPGVIALLGSVFLFERLRDTPASLGLPPADEYMGDLPRDTKIVEKPKQSYGNLLLTRVFNNPYIWLISIANFFVYVLRGTFLYWAPTYFTEAKHLPLSTAGYITAAFELAGLFGSLAAGWISDRYMKGRRAPVCVAFMLAACASVYVFSLVPAKHALESLAAVMAVGFTVYGPQFMVAVMAADLASKEAAATAVGVTGIFGYASGIVTGWGTGEIVTKYGWNTLFQMLMASAVASAIFFAMCWKSRARVD